MSVTWIGWVATRRRSFLGLLSLQLTADEYRRGGWQVDIRVVAPDGTREIRQRKQAPVCHARLLDDGLKVANAYCSND